MINEEDIRRNPMMTGIPFPNVSLNMDDRLLIHLDSLNIFTKKIKSHLF